MRTQAKDVIKTNLFRIFYFQPEEDVGDIFQDQDNMAAILMRKHLQSGDLLMVSEKCFGRDDKGEILCVFKTIQC